MTGVRRPDPDPAGSLDHEPQLPAAQLVESRSPDYCENDSSRWVLEQAVPIERRAIGDPMRLTREHRPDRERDVLRCGAGAERTERPHDEVAASDAIDQAPVDQARDEVRGGLGREPTALGDVACRERLLALCRELV